MERKARAERFAGNRVRMSGERMWVNGMEWEWDWEKGELVQKRRVVSGKRQEEELVEGAGF